MKTTRHVADHRWTVICGNCEEEWSADERAGDAECPACTMHPAILDPGWDHVMRDDGPRRAAIARARGDK